MSRYAVSAEHLKTAETYATVARNLANKNNERGATLSARLAEVHVLLADSHRAQADAEHEEQTEDDPTMGFRP